MAAKGAGGSLRYLGQLFESGTVSGLSDPQLLQRFLSRNDEAAFEALVSKHGPMVLAVCRRRLADPNDVDDAFQATFLVLVRRARDVRDPSRLASWLYGVALKVAEKARIQARKRRDRERGAVVETAGTDGPEPIDDLAGPLHDEIRGLPDRYRMPIVLCFFQGLTHEEAARELGWPVGTVKGRIARAKELLRKRLVRRGVSVPASLIASVLVRDAAGSVPAVLIRSTMNAALGARAGEALVASAVSGSAVTLAQEVVRTMIHHHLRSTILGLAAIGLVGTGVGAYALQGKGKAEPEPRKAAKAAEKEKAPEGGNILRNGGFEEGDKAPAHWSQGAEIEGVEYLWDRKTGQQGKASLCLIKTADRYLPIAQWYQVVDRTSDKSALRVSAQVKAEGVTKAILDVVFQDEKGEWIRHQWVEYIGAKEPDGPPVSHDWKEYSGRVEIPQEAKKIQVGLQIYGPGKVWFDEVRAEYADGDEKSGASDNVPQAEAVVDVLKAKSRLAQVRTESLLERYQEQWINVFRQSGMMGGMGGLGGQDQFQVPRVTIDELKTVSETAKDQLAAAEAFIATIKRLEADVREAHETVKRRTGTDDSLDAGRLPSIHSSLIEFEVDLAEAQVWLAELKADNPGVSPSPWVAEILKPPAPPEPVQEPEDPEDVAQNEAIRQALQKPVSVNFEEQASLSKILGYVREQTKSENLPDGIPIYPDPAILQEADLDLDAPNFRLSLEGVPLKTALQLLLSQGNLTYEVRKGLLSITRRPWIKSSDDGLGLNDPEGWNKFPATLYYSYSPIYGLEDVTPADKERTSHVEEALRQSIPMPFGAETPVEDVLDYIREKTTNDRFPSGVPIYLDPAGLQEADKTRESPIVGLDLSGVRLKTTLELVLRQLGLVYVVRQGVLIITYPRLLEPVPNPLEQNKFVPVLQGIVQFQGGLR